MLRTLKITKESGNKKTVYGNISDRVVIIKDYGNVLIVEHEKSKVRFSVKESELNL